MFQFERKKLFFSHLNIYFDDMALAVIIFHWMYYLIAVERPSSEYPQLHQSGQLYSSRRPW